MMRISKIKDGLSLTCHKCKCNATHIVSNDVGMTGFYCEECMKEIGSNTSLYIRTVEDLQMIGTTLNSFVDWKREEILEFLNKIGVSIETFEYDLKIASLEFNIEYTSSFKGRSADEDVNIDIYLFKYYQELEQMR